MKIKICSIIVNDQEKALKFYGSILGFIKKIDMPAGKFRWLTMVSPEGPNDVEILLEPNENPATGTFQKALFEQGIPLTVFGVDDVNKEYSRLIELGVMFKQKPTAMGQVTIAMFDDTCGNYIQIVQKI